MCRHYPADLFYGPGILLRSSGKGKVIVHQRFGDMMRFNPHYHAIIVEGGFDEEGTFVSISFAGLHKMIECFRRKVIWRRFSPPEWPS
ncbi:MAG: transposase [Candidatus Thiodiazotropha sp.]